MSPLPSTLSQACVISARRHARETNSSVPMHSCTHTHLVRCRRGRPPCAKRKPEQVTASRPLFSARATPKSCPFPSLKNRRGIKRLQTLNPPNHVSSTAKASVLLATNRAAKFRTPPHTPHTYIRPYQLRGNPSKRTYQPPSPLRESPALPRQCSRGSRSPSRRQRAFSPTHPHIRPQYTCTNTQTLTCSTRMFTPIGGLREGPRPVRQCQQH